MGPNCNKRPVSESGLEVHALSPEVFPLPSLQARLREFARGLHQGHGFFTIRGLKPNSFSSKDNIIIHVGIASYIGDKRALQQNYYNAQAEALSHACDVKQYKDNTQEDVFLAPGNETIAVGFHSDNGDNVSLYCWSTAEQGGELYLSSAWMVYNELALKSPDVLRIFTQCWQWQDSRTGDEKLRSHMAPIIYFLNNRLVINYQKRPLRGSKQEPRDCRLDPLSREQEAALAAFDRVTAENAICLEQEPGDMHFFNNLALLHSRSAFRDGKDQAVQRHLTRLIFRNSELGWEIPRDLLPYWSKYYDHAREMEHFPEEPHPWAFSLSGHD
ncbi:putative TfdA family oxidoreductase [Fusarium austroafricanum]|uniref:Putative TfdA family oxidoreductase n=1 Tax=Fusarium austroafricanum TaxID=2364996 RepID=A0A8H4KD23_9HYPO|nr:putative TfdA family oxidoreductase [Fusarium austroafricanum]